MMTQSKLMPPETRQADRIRTLFARSPALGPTIALVIVMLFFSVATDTFFSLDNFSAVINQSVVIGALALGQTLVILTAGIDLANAAIAVFGTILITKLVTQGSPPVVGLTVGVIACGLIALVSGTLVARLKLPPFIVTLGMLAVVTAVTNIYSGGTTWRVPEGLLTWLGRQTYLFGGIPMTYGMGLVVVLYVVVWAVLSKTAWGRHVYAVGGAPEATRLNGINTQRTLISVYVVAGLIYGIAAWLSMGRTPTADPNAYQTGNLDSITAVVIGGTSLFGGRGGVAGTAVGALIVAVLRSGLTQMGIDTNYQNLATGVLVIAAVAFDQIARRRTA
jgi:fructose transport system permease protein